MPETVYHYKPFQRAIDLLTTLAKNPILLDDLSREDHKFFMEDMQPYYEYTPFMKGLPKTFDDYEQLVLNFKWTTREGEQLTPSQMGTRHILYTMRMMFTNICKKVDQGRVENFFPPHDLDDIVDYNWEPSSEKAFYLTRIFHGYHALYYEIKLRLGGDSVQLSRRV